MVGRRSGSGGGGTLSGSGRPEPWLHAAPDANESIRARLQPLFRAVFDEPDLELTRETGAASIAAWDSLSLILLVGAVEQEFGVRFSGQDLAEFESVGRLEDFLARRTGST